MAQSIGKNALLACVSSLIALAAAELVARSVFEPPDLAPPPAASIDPYGPNPFLKQARPYLHFHLPGAHYIQAAPDYEVEYRINRLGFRGEEFHRQAPDGLRRLLVIGDSFVEGAGVSVDQAFPSLLNERLNTHNWEVLNAGVQGASPAYYAFNLPRYMNLRPDAVLLALFQNDLFDDRVFENAYSSLPYLQRPSVLIRPNAANNSGSRFLSLLAAVGDQLRSRFRNRKLAALVQSNAVEFSGPPAGYAKLVERGVEDPELLARHWTMSASYLDHVVREFEREGVKVHIVSLARMRRGTSRDEMLDRYSELYGDKIREWALSRNLATFSFTDLSRRRKADPSQQDLTFPGDGHPSRVGHEFLAEHLAPWLRQQLE